MKLERLFDLHERVAVVTGGSRGLGLQLASALAEQGAQVAISARKEAQLKEAQQHLERFGNEVLVHPADLSKEEACQGFIQAVMKRWGRLDILVNNAGATWGAPAEEHPSKAWHKVIDLNLSGSFFLAQAAAQRAMIPVKSGSIINIASIAGLQGNHPDMMGTVAYNSSKGGLITMTKALAAEWAKHGIRVNAIAPGYFPTKMTRGTLDDAQDLIEAATPLGRVGGPDDLKGLMALLASDASAYITGQVIAVDGGLSAV